MKISIFTLCAATVLLGACTAHVNPHGVHVSPKPVVIDVDSVHGGSGKFCPPGQAKKGRC